MAYKIEGGQAFVEIDYEGKKETVVLKKLKFRDWAYSLDEFMTVKAGTGATIRIGAMMMATLPKSIVKAPFDLTVNNAVLEATLGLGAILEISNALMELNGVGGEPTKN